MDERETLIWAAARYRANVLELSSEVDRLLEKVRAVLGADVWGEEPVQFCDGTPSPDFDGDKALRHLAGCPFEALRVAVHASVPVGRSSEVQNPF